MKLDYIILWFPGEVVTTTVTQELEGTSEVSPVVGTLGG